jgi:hypothetical protein
MVIVVRDYIQGRARAHTHTHTHTHPMESPEWGIGLSYLYNTQHSQETDIHAPAGFEPAIRARERPQTYDLDHAAAAIGEIKRRG